jgi:hypothetical protein
MTLNPTHPTVLTRDDCAVEKPRHGDHWKEEWDLGRCCQGGLFSSTPQPHLIPFSPK